MLGRLSAAAADRYGDRPAFVATDRTVSYAELERRSAEVARGLLDRGVGPGSVVALALPTTPEYAVCYLAAAKVGAVTAGISTRLAPAQAADLCRRLAPALLVTATAGFPASARETVVLPLADGLPVALGPLAVPDGQVPPLPADPDRPVAVVFTSGTTGTPRGAVFAERQLDAIRRIDVGDTWGSGGATLIGTSLAHLGFMTKLPGTLQSGRTTHLLERWRAADALRTTAELHLTSVSGVPTQLALMLAAPEARSLDLSSVRMVLVGGAPATPALVRAARERFAAPVCTRYSCTEAGIGCATRPDDPPEDAEVSVGRPQAGVALAIRDEEGRDLPAGAVGDVLLRSAAVMSGYWEDPAATAAAFTEDGFVRTGDVGYVDDAGRLRLVGRSKEMYVRGGYNVFPVAVEAVLAGCPGVREVAVVAVPDPVMGEVGVACVVPDGPAPTLEALRGHAASRLARHELPERLLVVAELPLTAGDKVDRARLAAAARETADQP